MRLFFGSFLSRANQSFYARWAWDLAARHPGTIRPVPDASAHITYVFAADVLDEAIEVLSAAVQESATAVKAIDISIGRPHLIGGSRPRLICADIESGAAAVEELGRAISEVVQKACPAASWSPSRSPHVTLLRFRKSARGRDARSINDDLQVSAQRTHDDRISSVNLVVSRLGPGGPVYESRAEYYLSGRTSV
ncbi:MAG TPA: 2'-5' RNA ligase family protein [Vicinamibacterales bacterium]|jgi:2'-5' RNA ligase|nr:2'-5' RNA ligase family protein [Vicinamibacterales bacterium]